MAYDYKKQNPPEQVPEIQAPQLTPEQQAEMEALAEAERLNSPGYYRFHRLQLEAERNRLLNGIGTLLSQIGQTLDNNKQEDVGLTLPAAPEPEQEPEQEPETKKKGKK